MKAVAVMVTVPTELPVIFAGPVGFMLPAGKKIDEEIDNMLGLLLPSETNKPPAGAPVPRVML